MQSESSKGLWNTVKNTPTWAKITGALTATLIGFGIANRDSVVGPPKVESASQLATKADGESVTMTFNVEGSYKTYDGKILLNSVKNFSDPSNVTAVCNATQVPDEKSIVGKTVTVTGRKTKYKSKKTGLESTQIVVTKIEIKS